MRTKATFATYAGIALAAAGFVLIALGWNGAASVDCLQCQFPYLISGGLSGLALIAIGVGVMVIQALRQDATERAVQLEQLNAAVHQLAATLSSPDEFDPELTGEYRPRPRTEANGQAVGTAPGTWEGPA